MYHVIIFAIWTLAGFAGFFLASNSLIPLNRSIYYLLSYYSVFFLIVCGCNFGIWRKFQQRNTALQQQNRTQNQRLTKTLLFVTMFGLMSLLPFLIVSFLQSFCDVSIQRPFTQTAIFFVFPTLLSNQSCTY